MKDPKYKQNLCDLITKKYPQLPFSIVDIKECKKYSNLINPPLPETTKELAPVQDPDQS